ncbi:MAG TPA: ferredoxin, partial [candidate division Zixibacteria bacterium]|nr:ferredoxin [candidate division Zixibacteria bacterium]
APSVIPVQPSAVTPAAAPSETKAEVSSDDPYIETPRCTTCNECTNINNKMFAYNENKQAYIANPDAGTYAQLVEAAESCQVAIIHPGKPRNPNEPGLEELRQRAEPFR